MDNLKVIIEDHNFLVFLIVLVALMGLFVLVGNVIKTFREIKKPKDAVREDIWTKVKELKHQVCRIEDTLNDHGKEIDDIRDTNKVQCQAVKALLNHAIHNGNSDEMQKAANALDDYLTSRI